MYKTNLVTITEVKNVPPDIRPFVEFKAMIEERKLEENELVAVLVIDTTTSYIPVFLKDPVTLAALQETLGKQDAELTAEAKNALAKHLS
ncbi:MAG: DUF749 family protein [Candidatus Thermoplasmatota archaeon]|nr:DUF749 family protein [Candidatus Thermoplasmatota archaeon]